MSRSVMESIEQSRPALMENPTPTTTSGADDVTHAVCTAPLCDLTRSLCGVDAGPYDPTSYFEDDEDPCPVCWEIRICPLCGAPV